MTNERQKNILLEKLERVKAYNEKEQAIIDSIKYKLNNYVNMALQNYVARKHEEELKVECKQ